MVLIAIALVAITKTIRGNVDAEPLAGRCLVVVFARPLDAGDELLSLIVNALNPFCKIDRSGGGINRRRGV